MSERREYKPDVNEDEVKDFYLKTLHTLAYFGFNPTASDAIYLRESIRESLRYNSLLEEGNKLKVSPGSEAIDKLFLDRYNVDMNEYMSSVPAEDWSKAFQDVIKMINKKYRPEQELI